MNWHKADIYMAMDNKNSKNKQTKKHRSTKTYFIVILSTAFLIGLLFSILSGYLGDTHSTTQTLQKRAEITDVQGRPLALNQVSLTLIFQPWLFKDIDFTLAQLKDLLAWSPRRLKDIKSLLSKSDHKTPITIKEHILESQVSRIKHLLLEIPGVQMNFDIERYYPFSKLASHITGFATLATKVDSEYLPNALTLVGRQGVEKNFNQRLQENPEITLQLSIDIEIQKAAAKALREHKGAVVVMDVNTGALLVLLSKPGYDVNQLTTAKSDSVWQQWLTLPEKPLLNRVTQAAYSPSSTLTALIRLVALQKGIDLSDESDACGYNAWFITPPTQTARPCMSYLYRLGYKLGLSAIYNTALEWGLGVRTHIDLAPEISGVLPVPQSNRDQSEIENMYAAAGLSRFAVSPLQMVRVAAALANGGKILEPQLLAKNHPEVLHQLIIPTDILQKVKRTLLIPASPADKHNPFGALRWSIGGAYASVQKQPQLAHHQAVLDKAQSWFMGFAPFDSPQVAIAVFIEDDSNADAVAAATIKAIATKE